MGEIDGKMAIYRKNLGQNSRWNTNLPLKFKSGRWITNWDKSGRWITLLTLESHLGRWINAGVIWAVRSRWREERNIPKKSTIYRRNIADFPRPQAIIWRNHRFIDFHRYIADLLAIFCEKSSLDFSPGNAVSPPPDTRYIGDISPIFHDIFLHDLDCARNWYIKVT